MSMESHDQDVLAQISGRQIDIGDALRAHVSTELGVVIAKYARRPTGAQVIFSKSGSVYCCEATVHLSTGLTAQAKAEDHDIYAAFDQCAGKLEKQLRRYRRRLKDHHRDRTAPVAAREGSAYILAGDAGDEASEPEGLQPVIIAEMETSIPELSVGEAVMQMELAGVPVLVFRNEGRGAAINVVYRRDDGNIGWIDP